MDRDCGLPDSDLADLSDSMVSTDAQEELDMPTVAPRRYSKGSDGPNGAITTLEPAVTIVRGEADGSTTYYKIISTSTPGASTLAVGSGGMEMDSMGRVQLVNGALHFPNGTVVIPSSQTADILNNSDLATVTSANLMSSQPTMVSVSIPGASSTARYRSITLPELASNKRKAIIPASRDEKRRQTHNEVERRRRDKINSWITKLQAIVPSASGEHNKHSQSKGVVLSKAVDYINLLHDQLSQARVLKDNTQKMHLLAIENEVYKKQADVLKHYIREQGLELPSNMPTAALNALQELQQGTAILIAQQTRPQNK